VDAAVTVSVGSIVAFVGFLLQVGLTIGAIAFSHGQLNQRVRAVEEKQKDHGSLATSVTRLETEMESVGREIKGLREDLRLARNELRQEMGQRQPPQRPARSPYDFDGREWVTDQ
jgi:hypothetical protein